MRIATYNLEPKIVNTAIMQIWQWARENGHEVEHYNHLQHDSYDRIYAASLFKFTPKNYVTSDMICGGTGFDVKSRLPPEIEACGYDYNAYPSGDQAWRGKAPYSIVRFSIGCYFQPGIHPYCIVPFKEGCIRAVEPRNLNPDGKWIMVNDNNFFASPKWPEAIKQLKEWAQPVDFQGVDARLIDEEQIEALLSLKHYKRIKVAWDNPKENLAPKLEFMAGRIRPDNIMCYVLIGYWSTPQEDLARVMKMREIGINPFVMPYNKFDTYQKRFSRWVNRKAIFKSVEWQDYKKAPEMYEGQTKLAIV